MQKQVVSILYLLLAALVIIGCNPTTIENAVQSAEQSAAEVEQQATENAAPTSEPTEPSDNPAEQSAADVYGDLDNLELNGVTIDYWHQHSDIRGEELEAIIDEFNAINPHGITVESQYYSNYGDIYNNMMAGFATGDIPGILVAYQNQAAAYALADGLVDLDHYINHPTYGIADDEIEDFFEAFLNQDRLPQFGNASFGFPPNRSMEVMYYNEDWLSELGYDGPPQTPEEFSEMACAAVDDAERTVGYEISTDASRFASLVFARGGDIYDYDNNQYTLNSPEAIDAMTQIKDLYDRGCAILIEERRADEQDFANRRTLFTIGTSTGLPRYNNYIGDSFAWSIAPIPYSTAEPVQNIYGASISIPRTTPEEQLAAWLFLKYYTTPETQARWAKASNYFPVRESVANGLGDYFEANPAYQTAFDLLQYGKTEPPVAGYDNVRDEISEAYARILDGDDIEAVLNELNSRANEILAQSLPE